MIFRRTRKVKACSIFIFLLIPLLCSTTVSSDSIIEGSEHPELVSAINLWLKNDDENSLPLMAKLAREGNTAARLLLSRIERTERAPSAYLESLSVDEQQVLFRNPKKRGPFQLSWMLSEAESGNSLAALFLSSYVPKVDLDTIRALQAAGEVEATDHPVRIAALYGDAQIKKQLLDQLAPPQMRPFVVSQLPPAKRLADGLASLEYMQQYGVGKPIDIATNSHVETTARFLALGIPYGDITNDNPLRATISNWLSQSPEATPIRKACEQHCSNEVEQCGITLLGLTGGYYEAIRLDSPIENLISQTSFLKSPRAAAQALRRGALIRAEHGGEIASLTDIATQSECLARQVKTERQSTMYRATRY